MGILLTVLQQSDWCKDNVLDAVGQMESGKGDKMKITIEIPREFEGDWNDNRFEDCLLRLKADIQHNMAGNYEIETTDMLIEAFKKATVADGDIQGEMRTQMTKHEAFLLYKIKGICEEALNTLTPDEFSQLMKQLSSDIEARCFSHRRWKLRNAQYRVLELQFFFYGKWQTVATLWLDPGSHTYKYNLLHNLDDLYDTDTRMIDCNKDDPELLFTTETDNLEKAKDAVENAFSDKIYKSISDLKTMLNQWDDKWNDTERYHVLEY